MQAVEAHPSVSDCDTYAGLLDEAAVYGFEFMDATEIASPGSLLESLRSGASAARTPNWPIEVADFTAQCLQALLGTAALHLHGVSRLVAAGPVIFLHPLAGLIRSIGEACGSLFWQIEPWVDRNVAPTSHGDPAEALRRHHQVVLRAELRHVTELHSRRRRVGEAHGRSSWRWIEADRRLTEKKVFLADRFDTESTDSKPRTNVKGNPNGWTLNGTRMPTYRDLVHHAVESDTDRTSMEGSRRGSTACCRASVIRRWSSSTPTFLGVAQQRPDS